MKRRLLYTASILALVAVWRADVTLAHARSRLKPGNPYLGSLDR